MVRMVRMKTAKEREKERLKREKKHAPINRRLRVAKTGGITVSIPSSRSPATEFFNKWLREEVGIPVKGEDDE